MTVLSYVADLAIQAAGFSLMVIGLALIDLARSARTANRIAAEQVTATQTRLLADMEANKLRAQAVGIVEDTFAVPPPVPTEAPQGAGRAFMLVTTPDDDDIA